MNEVCELLFDAQRSRFKVNWWLSYLCLRGEQVCFWSCCHRFWGVTTNFCRGSLLKGPDAAHIWHAWCDECSFVCGFRLWVLSNPSSTGTPYINCFLQVCLTFRCSDVPIFVSQSLFLSQLQSLSEVSAGAFHSSHGRWDSTVNVHKQNTHCWRNGGSVYLKYLNLLYQETLHSNNLYLLQNLWAMLTVFPKLLFKVCWHLILLLGSSARGECGLALCMP